MPSTRATPAGTAPDPTGTTGTTGTTRATGTDPVPADPAHTGQVPARPALVEACLAAPPRCGGTRVIAVDGRSGAGKSTLTRSLSTALAERATPVHAVELDDVYPGWDGLLAVIPLIHRWLLRPLAAGQPAGYYRYDWRRGTHGAWQPVAPGGVLILEGVGSGAVQLAPLRSLLIWVQAPDGVRRRRAISRDGEPLTRQWRRWAEQEARYLSRDRPRERAGLVVDTGENPATPARTAR